MNADGKTLNIRRLYPPRPDATPLYVQEQGAYVSKSGNSLVVKVNGEIATRAGIKDVSQLVLCGNIRVSTQTLHLLCETDIPVCYLSSGMWFHGIMHGHSLRNAYDRAAQFAYAILAKECTVAILSEGLDPYWGFYHQPRHGRSALALDLMEPFRPVIADSVVITAINTGMVSKKDFETAASGCAMNSSGRKSLLQAYKNRLDQLVTHPIFDYRCSWRSVIRLQARLLARWLRGDIPTFSNVVTR